ncbi:two-component system phosphate regulon response regulator PhoB [Rhizobium sp. BK650]|uniref:winged helix-turn-helix domain-containing protein n=1 Tax=Rhizobium sp. BK650 TaxID=2586990 RepID=UPI00161D65E3|nr:winged helix-turn-helix domain-containing protein [Rhizobium sp. BK650]MBB3660994.1 two-component system phosphate regulon response regulator PhoB [Rhizobium sp. BK650]
MTAIAGFSEGKPLVLLIGDVSFGNLLQYVLESEGFSSLVSDDAAEAVELSRRRQPNVVTLDTNLPRGSFRDVLWQMRKETRQDVPVMLLASNMGEVRGLYSSEYEPTDIVLKPFSPATLVGRIRYLLDARYRSEAEPLLCFAGISVDRNTYRAYLDGDHIPLSPTEFRLLEHLVRHPRRVFSRAKLLEQIWGDQIHVVPRTIDVHMSRLRKALSNHAGKTFIRTVRSVGYSLDSE